MKKFIFDNANLEECKLFTATIRTDNTIYSLSWLYLARFCSYRPLW